MGTKIERLEKSESKAMSKMYHVKAMIDALIDPSKWEYTGNCWDNGNCQGRCVCGQIGIRYEFEIESKQFNRKEIVGSSCINHFASINPTLYEGMQADYTKILDSLKEAEKKAKEAQQNEEIDNLKWVLKELQNKVSELIKYERGKSRNSYWLPYELYSWRRAEPKKYERKIDYIKWYKKEIESNKKLLLSFNWN